MPAYDFLNTASQQAAVPSGRQDKMAAVLDLKGLDLVTPTDLMTEGRTPFAKNFRLYAQQTDDRQVAVSSRKGPGFYLNPLSEAESVVNTATTGADTATVGIVTNVHMQPFTAIDNNRLTKVDIKIGNPNSASGPVIVSIYDDDGGKPNKMLTQSALLNGDIDDTQGYVSARFVKSALLTSGNKYWIVLNMQDDGLGNYELSTTTAGTKSWVTNSSVVSGTEQTYGLNFKTYTTPVATVKGAYRFARDNGNNVTLIAIGTVMYKVDEGTNTLTSIATGLSSSATEYSFTNGDNKVFWVNGYDNLKAWDGTTVETITDTELPILSEILMHKDRLWGKTAADPNKLVFSENPGNPAFSPDGVTPTDPDEQWYYAWLSVSFIYVPRPHNGSPITKLVSFQDSLIVFTQDRKYVISGYDRGTFNLREATGARGALSTRGVTSDENHIYFVSDDGLYDYNGSSDTKLSQLVAPLFDGCGQKQNITPVLWQNKIRFYMASPGSPVNDTTLLYNKDIKEWEYDTDSFVDFAVYYGDADDDQELIEVNSLAPFAVKAEQGYNNLGAPIDFEYDFPYSSFGSPGQRKRIIRYYPLLQGVDSTYKLHIAMDKDFQNSPRIKEVMLTTSGHKLGTFKIGPGTLLGGSTSFKMNKLRFSGYGYYWQLRLYRKAVNNRVAFIGSQFTYKSKRL